MVERFAVAVLAAAVLAILVMSSTPATPEITTALRIVQPGDSLWAIASEHRVPGMSTQEVVAWLQERNGLDDALLIAGTEVAVPENVQERAAHASR